MTLHFRCDRTTRRVKHVAAQPFTVQPSAEEEDIELDVTEPPTDATGEKRWERSRLTTDYTALEVDPAMVPTLLTAADIAKARIDALELYIKAAFLVVLDEVNAGRQRDSLGAYTAAQFWNAIKAKVDNIS